MRCFFQNPPVLVFLSFRPPGSRPGGCGSILAILAGEVRGSPGPSGVENKGVRSLLLGPGAAVNPASGFSGLPKRQKKSALIGPSPNRGVRRPATPEAARPRRSSSPAPAVNARRRPPLVSRRWVGLLQGRGSVVPQAPSFFALPPRLPGGYRFEKVAKNERPSRRGRALGRRRVPLP